jgi:hypothetical protein
MKGASTQKIIEVVRKCPTRALTYDWNDPSKVSLKPGDGAFNLPDEINTGGKQEKPVEIRIMKNGPYVVEGQFKIIDSDGREMKKMKITSICRCGKSGCLPLCDGSHRIHGFFTD